MGIKNIGWIGTGVMGSSMCMHIVKAGFNVFVYNRTREKASGLINKGAAWVDSAGEMAGKSDIIFSIVGYPKDVEETILGKKRSA